MSVEYKHNFAGGYVELANKDEFTLNFQNQVTVDGTFHDLGRPPTTEQGFNIPFLRTYFYGNILKDWEYQVSTQFFINTFNILDAFVGYKFSDEVNVRMGHFLSPFLYEYYAFSPAWEPVITNSPLFQLAGKRQTGVMFWGKLAENTVQYQVGVFNGPDGAYFDLDRNLDGMGSITVTPFKNDCDSPFRHLGAGIGFQAGRHEYNLALGVLGAGNSNGEPTTQGAFIGSTGIPFLLYNGDVRAAGMRTKVSPHFFWFGQFSVLAEYVWWNRALANPLNQRVTEVVHGYQITASYFLTGEEHTGDGLLGFSVITPNNPYIPSKCQYGTGAWELSAQFSQLHVSDNVVARGLVNPAVSATRLTQTMVGVNWWPNKYTRFSLDWMHDSTNRPVDLGGGNFKSNYNVYWTRVAMFF